MVSVMDQPGVCRYCGKLFKSRSSWNDHKRKHIDKAFTDGVAKVSSAEQT